MLLPTHLLFAALVGKISFPSAIFPCVLGGLLPDADIILGKATSHQGRFAKALSHRGALHSAWAAMIFSFPFLFANGDAALAFLSGYLSHLLLDALTPAGVRILYPSLHLRGPFKTGSVWDYILLAASMTSLLFLLL